MAGQVHFVDSEWGASYRIEADAAGAPVEIARQLHNGTGPPLKITGRVARMLIKRWRDQQAAGANTHV